VEKTGRKMKNNLDQKFVGILVAFEIKEKQKEIIKEYFWGKNGLSSKLAKLKRKDYGIDVEIILFQFYINPIPYLRNNLKEIANFKRKEKSFRIPVILNFGKFNRLADKEKELFMRKTLLNKLDLLYVRKNRNNFDLNIDKLKHDIELLFY
jgi:hypothetical protein